MRNSRLLPTAAAAALCALLLAGGARADESVAVIKLVQGEVRVQRGEQKLAATVGMDLLQSDRILTGANGTAGLSFRDGSLLSVGPDGDLAVDRFRFDSTTHEGAFETTLSRGKLAVVSGKIAKHQQDAMKVHTPTTTLGVRGTEFLVEAGTAQP